MKSDEPISLSRDCDAVMIPSGDRLRLAAGSQVWVTQSLGGSFTVMTDRGLMVCIDGNDADAIGVQGGTPPQSGTPDAAGTTADIEQSVWAQLKTCFDPEIPINIVDLGLIYDCRVAPLPEGGNRVEIKFTLTARGCGMGGVLTEQIQKKILSVTEVREAHVELVWDPPWDQTRISGAAKIQLGML